MKNFEYCAYTYRHRQAIKYLIPKLIKDENIKKEMMKRANVHDMDKLILYQFLDKKQASKYHRETSPHHMTNNLPKTYFDKLEAIIDYESAGYTKPDKPLNAFDTINRFKQEKLLPENLCNELLQICKEYGIDKSYFVTSDSIGMKELERFNNVTEEMIYNDIINYFLSKEIEN